MDYRDTQQQYIDLSKMHALEHDYMNLRKMYAIAHSFIVEVESGSIDYLVVQKAKQVLNDLKDLD